METYETRVKLTLVVEAENIDQMVKIVEEIIRGANLIPCRLEDFQFLSAYRVKMTRPDSTTVCPFKDDTGMWH